MQIFSMRKLIAASLGLGLGATGAFATSLPVSGGFDTAVDQNNFHWSFLDPAWIGSGNGQFSDNDGDNKTPQSGAFDNFLANDGAIYQHIGTVAAGSTLSLTFYIGAAKLTSSVQGGGFVTATYNIDGTNTNDNAIHPTGTNSGGTDYSQTFDGTIATGGVTVDGYKQFTFTKTIVAGGDLTLRFTSASGFPFIDSVSNINVPEPASLGILGVGALGLLARRRRA